MLTQLFEYELPEELIAQTPLPRGTSRLLVLHRSTGRIEHRLFADLPEYLTASDTLVVNDTRVSARRLAALRDNGKAAEVLLLAPVGEKSWHVLVKPGRSLRPGRTLVLLDSQHGTTVNATVTESTPEGGRIIELADTETRELVADWGETPLPPYIHTALKRHEEDRYQTVYAKYAGSAAAPTAGLHFTPELLDRISNIGVARTAVTLHVGVGTFRPVKAFTILEHEMHHERFSVTENAAQEINATRGRIVAVGTTTVRALESSADPSCNSNVTGGQRCAAYSGSSQLFISPGFRFRCVDALITNFHQPRSTLLMMISALASREQVMQAYREAIEERYRFFSFGDAMLIL